MILAKGPIKKQNVRLLIAHMKFHQIYALLHAFMLPLMKVYIKFQLKSIKDLCIMTLKSDGKFK